MRYLKYLISGIIILFVGYLIGNWIPIYLLSPEIIQQPITSADYSRLVVSIVAALITFLAVLVALFKDDIREMWKRPNLKYSSPEKITIEETSDTVSPKGTGTLIEAQKYISRVEVKNTGNVTALSVEIFLEKLEFKERNSGITESLDPMSTPLLWCGTNKDSMIIPPGSGKLLNIVEISAPQTVSVPDDSKANEPSKLIIGNIENQNQQINGTWTAQFGLYAQNHNPITFTVTVEWKGVWKTRLTEMEKQYKITIK